MNTNTEHHQSLPTTISGRTQCGRTQCDRGQTTAEYALVLLAAATIAMLVVTWAQGNSSIDALFDSVITKITSLMT